MAVELYESLKSHSPYFDKQQNLTKEEYFAKLDVSTTLYIGNLSKFTREEQVIELFSRCGRVSRVIMGLDRYKKTPCGFCFVEFFTHDDAHAAVDCISGTVLEDQIIRADWDIGFREGRQFGRGKGGGQKRDSMREMEESAEDFKKKKI